MQNTLYIRIPPECRDSTYSEALLVKYTASVDAFSGLSQTSPISKKHSELGKIQSPKAVFAAACKQGRKPQLAQVKFDVSAWLSWMLKQRIVITMLVD